MVLPIVKKITGKTIAEIIVINVRASIAAKSDVAELKYAMRMFFKSFILQNCIVMLTGVATVPVAKRSGNAKLTK